MTHIATYRHLSRNQERCSAKPSQPGRGPALSRIKLRRALASTKINCGRHIDDIKEGKAAAAAAGAEAMITKEEYYFLNAASSSMSDPDWFDPEHGNLLHPGANGDGARDLADAFAGWKAQGGRFITTGLSGELDPKKYAAFAKVVLDYRQKLRLQGDDAPLPRRRTRASNFEE